MPDSNVRATLVAGDERIDLVPGDEPLQMLAVGGVPGRPYVAPAFGEFGAGETPA
jgi:hypothetical protein